MVKRLLNEIGMRIGGGALDPAYEGVIKEFRRNFSNGWEEHGAAFSAFVDGRCVVDVWGGYADRTCGRVWREDTLSTIFSCTKSIASICVAMQVEAGNVAYSDLVSRYWPEYAQHGKEHTTVLNILQHEAGIPYLRSLPRPLQVEDIVDEANMDKVCEAQRAHWPPGHKSAYHALSFGWLIDGLFRRVDPKRRNIGEFFREEVAERYNIDVYIGRTSEIEHRTARIFSISPRTIVRECMHDPFVCKIGYRKYVPFTTFARAMRNMNAIGSDFDVFNNPDLRLSAQPAVNAIATARALAQTHQLLADGYLVSTPFLKRLLEPMIVDVHDETIGERLSKGHGFFYNRSPLGDWQLSHMGVGGQIVKADIKRRLTFAYITNGMKAGQGEHTLTAKRLERRLYRCWQEALETHAMSIVEPKPILTWAADKGRSKGEPKKMQQGITRSDSRATA